MPKTTGRLIMGANITLRSVLTPEKANAVVDRAHRARAGNDKNVKALIYATAEATGAYFYDPYNAANILAALGMAWQKDVKPLLKNYGNHEHLDDEGEVLMVAGGELPVEAARHLHAQLESKPVTREIVGMVCIEHDLLEKMHIDDGEVFAFLHEAMFALTQYRKVLMALLRRSIELNEPLWCVIEG
jgi:hypothetical protein